MKRFLILGVIVLFILIVVSRVLRVGSASPQLLPFGVGLGLGATAGVAWARAHRSYADWRGARLAVPRLLRDLVAKGKRLVGVAAAVAGVVLVIVAAMAKGH